MLTIVLGTRPEIIKMSPVIRELERRKTDFHLLHTGQHYSANMDAEFFEDLKLPQPTHNLGVGNRPYRKQLGVMVRDIRRIFQKDNTSMVLVQGDTLSVLAGALAASKEDKVVGHHEAGLRSYDITMIEETNRIITDHVSDYLFAPTKTSVDNLMQEGIPEENIFLTGNTIVDAVQQNLELSKKSKILENIGVKKNEYFIATCHRAENTDKESRLNGVLKGLDTISKDFKKTVIFSMHPRTAKRIKEFNITIPESIKTIAPPSYLDFLWLEANSQLMLTDSGGLQEEACILSIPCVTLRDNTERPETIKLGINTLVGTSPKAILNGVRSMLNKPLPEFENPFGDGTAGEKIVDIIIKSGK